MPDRTKMPRGNAGRGPTYIEGDNEPIRSDLAQNPRIPGELGNTLLGGGSVCTVGNQMCPPGSISYQYEPRGKTSKIGETGPAYLPRPSQYHGK